MLSGPELSRLQKQLEREFFSDDDPDNPQNFQNHEQGVSTQTMFHRQVGSLCNTIRNMRNPFLADFLDLVSVDSRDCADESVIVGLHSLKDTGKSQYQPLSKMCLKNEHGLSTIPSRGTTARSFESLHLTRSPKKGRRLIKSSSEQCVSVRPAVYLNAEL